MWRRRNIRCEPKKKQRVGEVSCVEYSATQQLVDLPETALDFSFLVKVHGHPGMANVRGKAGPAAERVRLGRDDDDFGPAGPCVRSC